MNTINLSEFRDSTRRYELVKKSSSVLSPFLLAFATNRTARRASRAKSSSSQLVKSSFIPTATESGNYVSSSESPEGRESRCLRILQIPVSWTRLEFKRPFPCLVPSLLLSLLGLERIEFSVRRISLHKENRMGVYT